MVLIAPILIGLAPLVAFMLLYGLRASWATILHAIKHWLANPRGLVQRIADPFGIFAQPRVHQGENEVGKAAQAAAPATTGFLSHVAGVIEYVSFTTAYIAEGTLEAFYALRHATIPKAVKAGTLTTTRTATRTARLTRAEALRITHGNAALAKELIHVNRLALRAEATAERALAIAAAPAIPVAQPYPRTAPVEWPANAWRAIRSRMGRVEKIVLGAGLTIAGLRVLARHLPWYRCTNVNRLARGLCRADRSLIDSLIADTLILAGTISIVEFARECEAFTEVVTGAMSHFVREFPREG